VPPRFAILFRVVGVSDVSELAADNATRRQVAGADQQVHKSGSATVADSSSEKTILKVLDWAYEQAVDGVPGVDSASDLARNFMDEERTLEEQVDSLIRWQNAKAATSGFVSGLGGLITMPVAVPANISVVLFVQVRMIAAIAIMGGYDIHDDRVKTLVYACMAGNAAKGYLREVGIDITQKLALSAIRSIPGRTLTAINRRVGFRLLTKFGEKGVINIGKAMPLVGAIIGATFEAVSTNMVGNAAKGAFCRDRGREAQDVPHSGGGQEIEVR